MKPGWRARFGGYLQQTLDVVLALLNIGWCGGL